MSLMFSWYLHQLPFIGAKGRPATLIPLTKEQWDENIFYLNAIAYNHIQPFTCETERQKHIKWTKKEMIHLNENIHHVKELLALAKRAVVSTGAGVSAESGISTFRGARGLWLDHKVEDVATFEGFQRDPELVWRFYNMRRRETRKVKPNAGHYALVGIEKQVPHFTLITQNIDSLHRRAGSVNVLELHGNLCQTKCSVCDYSLYESEPRFPGTKPDRLEQIKCPECKHNLRPNVVWFREMLPVDQFSFACKSIKLLNEGDIFFTIGTSHLVYPAADFPTYAAKRGAHVVEINIKSTFLKHHIKNMICLTGASGAILPQLVQ